MNYILTLSLFLYIPLAIFYLMMTVATYRRRRLHQVADYFLVFYLGLSFVETLALLINELGGFNIFVSALKHNLPLYGLLLLTGLLLNLTLLLFRKEGPGWQWLLLTTAWVLGVDQQRRRVSLTMVRPGSKSDQPPRAKDVKTTPPSD